MKVFIFFFLFEISLWQRPFCISNGDCRLLYYVSRPYDTCNIKKKEKLLEKIENMIDNVSKVFGPEQEKNTGTKRDVHFQAHFEKEVVTLKGAK